MYQACAIALQGSQKHLTLVLTCVLGHIADFSWGEAKAATNLHRLTPAESQYSRRRCPMLAPLPCTALHCTAVAAALKPLHTPGHLAHASVNDRNHTKAVEYT